MKPAAKWTMIVGGAIALGGPILGVLGTVAGMMSSMNTLEKSGSDNAEALSYDIGTTLISSAWGIALGVIGAIVFVVGLILWLTTRKKPAPPLTMNRHE